MKNTKRALLLSVVSMFLCVVMLASTTFAWFTDSVESTGNIIKTGTLEVEMTYSDALNGTYADASTGKIFNYNLWEPGYTDVKYIKIENKGDLAFKYMLSIIPEGDASILANVIDVYFTEVGNGFTAPTRSSMGSAVKVGTLADMIAEADGAAHGQLLKTEAITACIALKMQESAGNEYQNLTIGNTGFRVQLLATQLTYEEDSFDENYDVDSEFAVTVTNGNDLRSALDNNGNIIVNGEMNVTDTVDVPSWTNAPAEYIVDATWVDSVTGGTYILDQASRYGMVARVSAGETLSLSNMNITANSQWPLYFSNYGGELSVTDVKVTAANGAGIYPYGTNGTTTLNNINVNQERLDPAYASATPWAATAVATSNGHNLIINSGTYVGSKWAVYGYNSGSNITINGGTFKAPKVIQLDGVWSGSNTSIATINGGDFDGAIVLDWGDNAPELYIKGGNFTNFSATVNGAAKLVITGGTFDADPSAYVATGYVANESNGVWTVTVE